jgi:archaeosine synthase
MLNLKAKKKINIIQMHEKLYQEISRNRGRSVKIKRSLCFYSPHEVYIALTKNSEVTRWLEFISNHYIPFRAKVLLIYPCSAEKPYHKSRSYNRLFETLKELGELRKEVHVITISEPFGLVPEEFFGKKIKWHDWKNSWYDCPGLFEWWCKRYGQPYEKEVADECIEILAFHIAQFLKKAKEQRCYSRIIAFVRTYSSQLEIKNDHTHRRIIELAAKLADVQVDMLPPKHIVANIVSKKGRFSWDMYGIAHPNAQRYLLNYLKRVLKDVN